ncbi:hypothetical protein O77CONTIG1_02033 [Leptolyngbya sp. O-77]|nr:hypothetical protein O77CONTIG1_02033 [Leptolyngbya sp. O-77]
MSTNRDSENSLNTLQFLHRFCTASTWSKCLRGMQHRFEQLAQVTTVVSQFSPDMPNKKVSIYNKSLPEGFLLEQAALAQAIG